RYKSHRDNVDDVGFILALIAEAKRKWNIDQERVYVTGPSNGGGMTQRLACEAGEHFAAAATVIGAMSEKLHAWCKPKGPLPMLLMAGTDDKLILWEGGKTDAFGLDIGSAMSVPA